MVGRCLLIPGAGLCLVTFTTFGIRIEEKSPASYSPSSSLKMPMTHLPLTSHIAKHHQSTTFPPSLPISHISCLLFLSTLRLSRRLKTVPHLTNAAPAAHPVGPEIFSLGKPPPLQITAVTALFVFFAR